MMTTMTRFAQAGLAVCAAAAFSFSATTAQANLLTDPSFEGALTFDGPPFVGFWEGFNAGGASSAINGTTSPLSGAQTLELQIAGAANLFAGAFQDVTGLTAGDNVVWSGWTLETVGSMPGGSEIRIEFRNAGSNTEISRTTNLVPTFTQGQYEPWSVPAVVPAGADTARLVYAIQSFGGATTQLVYVDDVSFVPEPASLALLSLGGLALLRRRA